MARTNATAAEALERVPLLSEVSKRDRRALASSMKEQRIAAGKQLLVEGRRGVGFFVIAEGSAAVSIGGEVIRMLGPGDYFGEMALVDGGTRSATVTADSEMTVLAMSSWTFKGFVQDNPSVAWALLQTMAQRLRESSLR